MITLVWSELAAPGAVVRVTGAGAQHARVRRVEAGAAVRLVDGRGRVATGAITALSKGDVTIEITGVVEVPRPVPLEVIVPVADRDRMLWAAEKCVELQVTAWRPAYFARSRSVSPRGEGEKFRGKLQARMESALEQCGGAWMPAMHGEVEGAEAFASVPRDWNRLILDAGGNALPDLVSNESTSIAVGPEGGFEHAEIAAAVAGGWVAASLGPTILRFETATLAGVAVIRATQLTHRS